ncbi:MAG: FIST N-terminal domain-containing protein [Candidatus Omnitrophica bacterium]|nr:FIST N-terminal domain-containing protein [Candidatus Omnitrophota bacterium]
MPTIQTGLGISTEKHLLQAAQDAVHQAKTNLQNKKVDLAFVFCSIDLSNAGLLKTIGVYLEGAPVIGCSSTAIISRQGIIKQGVAVLLVNFTEGIYFNTACVKDVASKGTLNAGQELGEKLLYGFRDIRRDLSIIFLDGMMKEASNFINGMQQRLGTSFPLVGASASDDLRFLRSNLHFNQDVFQDGACGILFGGKINFGLGIKHGWQPLGKPRRVTSSRGNTVYEIDGLVASKLYEEYFAYSLDELKRELKHISVLYPIGIYLAGEKEYLLRNILSIQDDGALVFQGEVPENSEIRLMIGTKESALEATRQAFKEAKNNLVGKTISFFLIFDSISRYILLGRNAHAELEILKNELDNQAIPIIGLYTYGEQAPLTAINYRGRAYFHNQTITVLAIGG